MVTRVTQGHSGRPLVLPPVAAYAFVAVQTVCVVRIVGELMDDWLGWQAVAAAGWLIAFLPWILWAVRIYTSPRIDGRPGSRAIFPTRRGQSGGRWSRRPNLVQVAKGVRTEPLTCLGDRGILAP